MEAIDVVVRLDSWGLPIALEYDKSIKCFTIVILCIHIEINY